MAKIVSHQAVTATPTLFSGIGKQDDYRVDEPMPRVWVNDEFAPKKKKFSLPTAHKHDYADNPEGESWKEIRPCMTARIKSFASIKNIKNGFKAARATFREEKGLKEFLKIGLDAGLIFITNGFGLAIAGLFPGGAISDTMSSFFYGVHENAATKRAESLVSDPDQAASCG